MCVNGVVFLLCGKLASNDIWKVAKIVCLHAEGHGQIFRDREDPQI